MMMVPDCPGRLTVYAGDEPGESANAFRVPIACAYLEPPLFDDGDAAFKLTDVLRAVCDAPMAPTHYTVECPVGRVIHEGGLDELHLPEGDISPGDFFSIQYVLVKQ